MSSCSVAVQTLILAGARPSSADGRRLCERELMPLFMEWTGNDEHMVSLLLTYWPSALAVRGRAQVQAHPSSLSLAL